MKRFVLFWLLLNACQSPAKGPQVFVVPHLPDSASDVTITVNPARVKLHVGGWYAFRATVSGATDPGVLWSVNEPNGGSIGSNGIYKGPNQIGIFHVTAYSRAFPAHQVTAVVDVRPLVSIDPAVFMGVTGETTTFHASVLGVEDQSVAWSIDSLIGGGTLSAGGTYQAPQEPGLYSVRATSRAFEKESTTAVVSIAATAPWGNYNSKPIIQVVAAPDGGFTVLRGNDEVHHFNDQGLWQWGNKYEAQLSSLAVTDTGYILAGGLASGSGGWLASLNSAGNLLWQRSILGVDGNHFWFITRDADGNGSWAMFIDWGYPFEHAEQLLHFSDEGDFIEGRAVKASYGGAGRSSFVSTPNNELITTSFGTGIISKLASTGELLWSYGVTSDSAKAFILSISSITSTRTLLQAGSILPGDSNFREWWMVAVDDLGNSAKIAWQFNLKVRQDLCYNDGSSSIIAWKAVRASKSAFISGLWGCNSDHEKRRTGAWLAEVSTEGKLLWQRLLVFPSLTESFPLALFDIAVSPLGEPVFAGGSFGNAPNDGSLSQGILFKVSPGGYYPFGKLSDFQLLDAGQSSGQTRVRLEIPQPIDLLSSIPPPAEVTGTTIIPVAIQYSPFSSLR